MCTNDVYIKSIISNSTWLCGFSCMLWIMWSLILTIMSYFMHIYPKPSTLTYPHLDLYPNPNRHLHFFRADLGWDTFTSMLSVSSSWSRALLNVPAYDGGRTSTAVQDLVGGGSFRDLKVWWRWSSVCELGHLWSSIGQIFSFLLQLFEALSFFLRPYFFFYAVSRIWTIFDTIIFELGQSFACLCCV